MINERELVRKKYWEIKFIVKCLDLLEFSVLEFGIDILICWDMFY